MLVDKLELFKTKLLFSSVQKFTLLVGVDLDVFSTLADTELIEALVRLSLDVGSPGDDAIWFVSLIALHRLFLSPEWGDASISRLLAPPMTSDALEETRLLL